MKSPEEKKYKRSHVIIMIAVVFSLFAVATYAYNISIPYTFSGGTTISSSAMNANFSAIAANMPKGYIQTYASAYVNSTSTAPQQLASYSFTAPASGYVLVQGGCDYVSKYHGDSAYSLYAYIGVAPNTTNTTTYAYNYFYTPSNEILGSSYATCNSQYTFSVTAGYSYTYYLNAYGSPGSANNSIYVYRPRLTVLFFPSYL